VIRFPLISLLGIAFAAGLAYGPTKLAYENWQRERRLKQMEERLDRYLDQMANRLLPEQEAAFDAGTQFVGNLLGALDSLDA